ncbi:MAG: signal peptidase I [Mucinivorans sp.]
MNKLREFWSNKWVRFSLVTTIYLLWFVVWTANLWWVFGVALIYDYYISHLMDKAFMNRYRAFKANHRSIKTVAEWVEAMLFAVVVVVPLKLYFFNLYVIPSSSMENTLLIGDYLFVDRLAYGPKMPNTPIAFPFVQHTLPLTENTPSFVDWIQFDYKRLKGYSAVQRGDVVVFNFPAGDTVALIEPNATYYDLTRNFGYDNVHRQSKVVYRPVDKRENYIKRCVGIAGDTLQVRNDTIYINHIRQSLPRTAILEQMEPQLATDAVFPHDTVLFPWNHKNYGPIWIPQKGATVELTIDNLPLYVRVIKNYENNALEVKDGAIYINGQLSTSYTFRMNYYFMMGDNRDNSLDSRFWGFVPEDHIEGKASFVWLSITPGKNIFTGMRLDRMFRSIK